MPFIGSKKGEGILQGRERYVFLSCGLSATFKTKASVRYNELMAVGEQVPQRKKEDWYDRLAWWSDVKKPGVFALRGNMLRYILYYAGYIRI